MTTKLHEPIEQVLFAVFEKFTSAYLLGIVSEIMSLLVNNLHEKCITNSQEGQNLAMHTICNLHSCYNFSLMLHAKCTRFQPIRCA